MMHLFDQLASTAYAADLNGLWKSLQNGYVKPIFIGMIAVLSLIFLKDQKFRALLIFALIAAFVGMFIFAGDRLFGSANSGLTGVAVDQAGQINAVVSYYASTISGMIR